MRTTIPCAFLTGQVSRGNILGIMERRIPKWWLFGLGSAAAFGAAVLFRRPKGIAESGDRLFTPTLERRLHVVNARGVVEADPAGLAYAADVPLDVYALASCMQSEESTNKGRLAVGLAAFNAAKKSHRSISKLMLFSKRKDGNGHFGTQAGRYADTRHPPTAKTLQFAAAILEGQVADITEGAIQWDAPKLQDANHLLFLRDPQKYPEHRFSAADIAAQRKAAGRRMVMVPGVTDTRFWA